MIITDVQTSKKYAIESTEFPYEFGRFGQGKHLSLIFYDAVNDTDPARIQELHFLAASGLKLAPAVRCKNKRVEKYKERHLYISGPEEHLRELWNRGLMAARAVGDQNLAFTFDDSADAITCRAGIKAVIEAMGLEFYPTSVRSRNTKLWELIAPELSSHHERVPLDELRMETEILAKELNDAFVPATPAELRGDPQPPS